MKNSEEAKRKRGRPPKEGALTATQRVSLHDEELVKSGGRVLNRIRLDPDANTALRELREQGGEFDSDRRVINIALIELKKNSKKD